MCEAENMKLLDSYYGAIRPEDVLTMSSIRDELVLNGGTITDSDIDAIISVDATGGGLAIALRPRPIRVPPGGTVSLKKVLRVEPGSTVVGRQFVAGFFDGDEIASFLIIDGELNVGVGAINGTPVTIVSRAIFADKLPIYDPFVFHTYEVQLTGLRASFLVDGVCVYEMSTANLSRDVLYAATAVLNIGATSGTATMRFRSAEVRVSELSPYSIQKRQRFLGSSTTSQVTAFRIADVFSQGRVARIRAVDLYTGPAIQSYDINVSRDEAPEALSLPAGQVIESGGVSAFGSQVLSLGVGWAPLGERVRIFEATHEDAPSIRRTVYTDTGQPSMPINTHTTLYVSVQALTAAAGTVILEASFDVE